MVVAAEHDGSDFSGAHHVVEFEGDIAPPERVLIEDSRLGAHDELVLLRVAYPDPVVAILAAPVRIDGGHRCRVGPAQVLALPGEADPTEGTVAVVEELGAEDILDVAREDEAVLLVHPVARDLVHAGVVDGLQEGIAVVEKVGPLGSQATYHFRMAAQRRVDEGMEGLSILF